MHGAGRITSGLTAWAEMIQTMIQSQIKKETRGSLFYFSEPCRSGENSIAKEAPRHLLLEVDKHPE
jgi:hypothetical protein